MDSLYVRACQNRQNIDIAVPYVCEGGVGVEEK